MKTDNFWFGLEKKAVFCVIIAISMLYFLPFILFGTDAIVTVHDNLDSCVPWFKMYHDNGLFLKFDAPTMGFCEMSTLYYPQVRFDFQSMLYMLFDDFTAYILFYYSYICLGYASMYILLKKLGFSLILNIFMSICYAMLHVIPLWGMAAGTLPFIIAVFIHFAFSNKNSFSWKILFLLFFPFFSSFVFTGIFVLGIWLSGIVVLGMVRKVNINLVVGFVLLCIGYILVDMRLFYVMFVLKTPLNRAIFSVIHPADQITMFFKSLKKYGLSGFYHATSFQYIIIIPLAFFVFLHCFIVFIRKTIKQSGKINARMKTVFSETNKTVKQLLILECIIFVFCFIAALYDSKLIDGFINRYIPVLNGFNYGRIYIFNRVLWYMVFALCLEFVLKIDTGAFIKNVKLQYCIPRLCIWLLVSLQIGYIALCPTEYNDQAKTWTNEFVIKTGIAKKIIHKGLDTYISYKEFYAVDLFEKIKKDIAYADERVAALGYHPSVLMYNGFNCIDGYNNAYPMSYMQRFRNLIAPELEVNQWAREYFDSWGGRMYLYNSELSYKPTRNKITQPVKLNIDMDVFRNDFDGRYILSRAEISNNEELKIKLMNRYDDEKSIYTIFLYGVY